MELMFRPLARFADFSGRSRRTEYWLFQLFQLIIYIIAWVVAIIMIGVNGEPPTAVDSGEFPVGALASFALLFIIWLVLLVPSTAVQVRRYHDQGMSGWLALLNIPYYIPYLGLLVGIAIAILILLPGQAGPNQYGDDPKGDFGQMGRHNPIRNVFE
jgi:uncharacterized membrane protein YhaH (DUF805 family)